jgi:hypothetical protein
LAGLVILAFGMLATAAPVAAAAPAAAAGRQITAAQAAGPISASVAAAVAAAPSLSATPAPAPRLQEQQAPAPAADSPSFFRSPKGIAALVLFVGGVAFTLHSMDKDRIHSPVR